ncbi:hypothetical protein DL546_006973 [Coniochaeta pulveracea]|uniref:Uncharacterized protein n=1 Tax=Coniochaeta pulveracea TaxID=177199 RepID=A0A420Y8Y7_9PEZI|nr:hypothetical protein DL546_006973 [Coniochaeta pulveracea]
MADLIGGGPVTTNGNRASAARRPTAPPTQTGSPSRGGVQGPVEIMRKRQERERQKKEKEAMELVEVRRREEQEALARLQQEEMRQGEAGRGAQHQQQAAGAGGGGRGGVGMGPGGASDDPQLDAMTQKRQQRAQEQGRTPASRIPSGSQQQQAQPLRASRVPTGGPADPMYGGSAGASSVPNVQPGETSNAATAAVTRTSRNSFPHAFERWEALSAHWEGMTSFWIRKLQENTQELDRNPVSAQLSRQVSDLSAAGANLFHAVVELQRLRASSERKFQRWFYETRNELERHQEEKATLQRQLDEERRNRQTAVEEAIKKTEATTQASSKTLKQLSEMRKELMISKEEARRAWEELGRREQEERDRTISLQNGLPTTVGGVQVVPMTQGVPSRQTSNRTQQQQPQRPQTRGEEDPGYGPSSQQQAYAQSPPRQQQQPGPSSSVGQSYGSGHDARYYEQLQQQQQQPEPSAVQERSNYGAAPEDNASDDDQEFIIDDHGRYVLDSQGKRIPFRSPGPVSNGSTPGPVMASQPSVTNYPPSSSQWAYSGGQPDYSGQGYDAPWDSVSRSHHPTRLSDVIEEDDERSRTSASQVSRA